MTPSPPPLTDEEAQELRDLADVFINASPNLKDAIARIGLRGCRPADIARAIYPAMTTDYVGALVRKARERAEQADAEAS